MVKRQHYVPRFYLNYFGNSGKVNYFDKVIDKDLSNMTVENVALQKYFYDFSDEFLEKQKTEGNESVDLRFFDKQFLEEYFAEFEGEFAKCLKKIAEKISNQPDLLNSSVNEMLDEEDRVNLVMFIVLQSIRIPAFRDLSGNFMKLLAKVKPEFSKFELDDNEQLLLHLASGILERVGSYLLSDNFEWFLGVVGDSEEMKSSMVVTDELLISDNPVIVIEHVDIKRMKVCKEFCLPLSPKHLLVIRGKNYPFENPENTIFELGMSDMKFYNQYQMRFSTRKVIYQNEDNAKKIHKFYKHNPRSFTHNSGSICVSQHKLK
ncbi:DUF4238 domain-containing protein [Bacillus toyonensis]|uniref:DUF4238 domain-containing protein n=1 Tax=Bacillus toyonensis TaxID=155322 RepID=UPI00031550AB|nr:DUF4238 domain-containing protein [Bacillus toyonensis]PEJ62424.1 DUF4238 domain-containing protein [Bacillus toyonensis]PGB31896.1 DUF4238 domain-containing protein [Bacillus toyonensis]PHG54335.1 DUF4238 domain-containing protein [Bacillus toyonensis]PKR92785.1 DNA repair protein [Bacillus cereus Rock4-18]